MKFGSKFEKKWSGQILAIFDPKWALEITKIDKNTPFKKIFLKDHMDKKNLTKFRYWLSLHVLKVYIIMESILNDLCKRIHDIEIFKIHQNLT